jgi:urease accessory protein UreF
MRNRSRYLDYTVMGETKNAIRNILIGEPACQKVIQEAKSKTNAIKQFCKENKIDLVAQQLYSMNAVARRTLKVSLNEAVRNAVNDIVGYN